MSQCPAVSIVVPCFNEAPAVVQASLDSLRQQTLADFECIVVDESTDSARAAACQALCERDPRFTYVHPTQRLGLAASLNLGISMARSELIARFDSDDLCQPDRLAQQHQYLQAHPEVGVVGGALEIMDEAGNTVAFRAYPTAHDAIARGMHLTNTMAHPTVMYRKAVVQAHGGYDPAFRFSEDLETWLRWLNAGVRFANLPGVLVRYRQQVTRRHSTHWRFNLRARTKNFAASHLLRRSLGIAVVAMWTAVPASLQEAAFRALIFRRRHPPVKGTA